MLLVLHATFFSDSFVIWAERSVELGKARPTKKTLRHPFAASIDELELALRGCDELPAPDTTPRATTIAWLPTRGSMPAPSSALLGDPPSSTAALELRAWQVPALELSATAALAWLAGCRDRLMLGPGVVLGADLRAWVDAFDLAASIVVRGRVLPGLVERDGWQARWQPLLGAEDRLALRALAKRQPGVARALSDSNDSPPSRSARVLVEAGVAALVDALVRDAEALDPVDVPPARSPTRARTAAKPGTSLHDRWLAALRGSESRVKALGDDLPMFAAQIRSWREPVERAEAAPYRLCLRLEEPAEDDSLDEALVQLPVEPKSRSKEAAKAKGPNWQLRYLIQPAEDPSLLIPFDQLWAKRSRSLAAAAINRDRRATQEFALAALGRAATISPPVADSLASARPIGHFIDAGRAHAFLTREALALEQAGFRVFMPSWWVRGRKNSLSVRAHVKSIKSIKAMKGESQFSLERLVQFDWEVAIGDQRLSADELERLAKAKEPLVRLRGKWIELDATTLAAAQKLFAKPKREQVSLRELVYMAIGARQPETEFAFAGVVAEGPIGELLGRLEQRLELTQLVPPAGLRATLRPYQLRGYSWLAFMRELGLGACLADDMGLGKTMQTLALIQRLREQGETRPVLLICPTSVVANWQREAERFTPDLRVLVHHGLGRNKGSSFAAEARQHALVLSSYPVLQRDLDHLQPIEWAIVVLDEAQNIKNPETKQAKAARSLEAAQRICLTGTPVENHVGELWSLMEFLNPDLLPNLAEFRRKFMLPIQVRRDPVATERLRKITSPFVLRRLKTDRSIIADLPEKLEAKVFCNLGKEQATLYKAVVRELEVALREVDGIRRKGMILATLTKLKQICDHPALFLADGSALAGRSGKLGRLVEMLEELLSVGDRALIFTQYAGMGHMLVRHLQESFGREVPFLHGAVTGPKRAELVERFQAEQGPAIFVLSLKAGGTGLNLTRANHVFHFDRWWNPAVENQATDRAFRIGQTRKVQVHKFVCAGTLEDTIDAMIERKRDVADNVVGSGEGWLTELSNADIRKLLALREDAIGD